MSDLHVRKRYAVFREGESAPIKATSSNNKRKLVKIGNLIT